MKKVAIITRTKNRPLFLQRLFESVSCQSYKNFSWVIINDGGVKEPVEEIYKKAKNIGIDVKIIHNNDSKGMEYSSNIGIKNSNSKYIVIHDDDDSWDKEFLNETTDFLESDKNEIYGGVVTQSNKIDELIKKNVCKIKRIKPYNKKLTNIYLVEFAKGNKFPPISFLYRRKIYNKINGYDENLPVLGDWDFNLRFLLEKDIAVIKKPLANYHLRLNKKFDDNYKNTVVHKLDIHKKYDAIIRNKYLREDIKENKIGLGFMINTRHMNEDYKLIGDILNIIKNILLD